MPQKKKRSLSKLKKESTSFQSKRKKVKTSKVCKINLFISDW